MGAPHLFRAAVDVALNTDFIFKASCYGTCEYNPNSSNSFSSSTRPAHMDLSLAETDEEAELRAVENIITFADVSSVEAQSI